MIQALLTSTIRSSTPHREWRIARSPKRDIVAFVEACIRKKGLLEWQLQDFKRDATSSVTSRTWLKHVCKAPRSCNQDITAPAQMHRNITPYGRCSYTGNISEKGGCTIFPPNISLKRFEEYLWETSAGKWNWHSNTAAFLFWVWRIFTYSI